MSSLKSYAKEQKYNSNRAPSELIWEDSLPSVDPLSGTMTYRNEKVWCTQPFDSESSWIRAIPDGGSGAIYTGRAGRINMVAYKQDLESGSRRVGLTEVGQFYMRKLAAGEIDIMSSGTAGVYASRNGTLEMRAGLLKKRLDWNTATTSEMSGTYVRKLYDSILIPELLNEERFGAVRRTIPGLPLEKYGPTTGVPPIAKEWYMGVTNGVSGVSLHFGDGGMGLYRQTLIPLVPAPLTAPLVANMAFGVGANGLSPIGGLTVNIDNLGQFSLLGGGVNSFANFPQMGLTHTLRNLTQAILSELMQSVTTGVTLNWGGVVISARGGSLNIGAPSGITLTGPWAVIPPATSCGQITSIAAHTHMVTSTGVASSPGV